MAILKMVKKVKSNEIQKRKEIVVGYIKKFYYDLAATNGEVNIPYFIEAEKEIKAKLNTDEKVNYWFRMLRRRKAI